MACATVVIRGLDTQQTRLYILQSNSSYLDISDFNLVFIYRLHISKHARTQKVLSGGTFFLDEGREDPKAPYTTIIGPSSACQQNAIEMAFRWRANDGLTLNAGLVAL